MNLRSSVLAILISWGLAVAQPPQHIISLTPSITEQLYLLGEGEKVVGITNFCRKIYPHQQIVGSYLQPNIEKILSLKPDIVIVSKEGFRKEIIQKIDQLNIKVLALEPVNNYEQLKSQFITLSKIFNKENIARKIISDYEKENEKEEKHLKSQKRLKAICILGIEPLVVASKKSYIGEVLSFSGLENPVEFDVKYPIINIEKLLKWNPDVIITAEMSEQGKKRARKYFEKYKNINAVRNNRIYILDANMLYQPTIKNFWLSVRTIKERITQK